MTTAAEAAGPGCGGRMSQHRKRDAVLRLLRAEDLKTLLHPWRGGCDAERLARHLLVGWLAL